jgi:hypothetical protein
MRNIIQFLFLQIGIYEKHYFVFYFWKVEIMRNIVVFYESYFWILKIWKTLFGIIGVFLRRKLSSKKIKKYLKSY